MYFTGLSYCFCRKEILNDVSFTVLPGQTLALVSLRKRLNSKDRFCPLLTHTAELPVFCWDCAILSFSSLSRWDRRALERAPSFDSSSVSMMFREAAFASMARTYQKYMFATRSRTWDDKAQGSISSIAWKLYIVPPELISEVSYALEAIVHHSMCKWSHLTTRGMN